MAGRPVRNARARAFGMGVLPQRQSSKAVHLPAPVGGIDTTSAASAMSPSDCIFLYNMIPFQYGLRVRSGWYEHATGVGSDYTPRYGDNGIGSPMESPLVYPLGGSAVGGWPGIARTGVRSILSFSGSSNKGLNDRLFACTKEGIWNVTSKTDAPTLMYTFPAQDMNSGMGIGTAFTNVAGEHFLAYCDGTNGYLLYRESTDDWIKIVQGTGTDGLSIFGADPDKFRYVMSWKNRLWFAQSNSAEAVYLAVGQYAGIVDNNDVQAGGTINFGSRFKYGGNLVGLWNWTVDGGLGIDDNLVGISSAGDVVIYAGTDPALPGAFGLKGVWWVGQIPPGRRIASTFGGDLFILSLVGCVPLSKLVAGYMIRDPNIYATAKVANLFNALMTERGGLDGWEINTHPTDNLLIINVPATPAKSQEQLTMALANKGWSRHLGIPMSCMETWRGKLYFGTFDNRVGVNDGVVDEMVLDGTSSRPIYFSLLTSFQNLGNAQKKRLHMVRPMFMTDGTVPGYETQSRWDFDITDARPTGTALDLLETGVWNQGVWDESKWNDGADIAGRQYGTAGMGTHVAIVLKGMSSTETTFVGFDVVIESGGIL